jgi:hypothetical protein
MGGICWRVERKTCGEYGWRTKGQRLTTAFIGKYTPYFGVDYASGSGNMVKRKGYFNLVYMYYFNYPFHVAI